MLRPWQLLLAGSIALTTSLSACTGPDHGGDFDAGSTTDAIIDVRRDVALDVPRDLGADVRADIVRTDVPVRVDVRDVPTVPDSGGRCADSCTIDTDCQTTCPATAGGSSNCCVFNVCTVVNQPVCPGSMMMGDAGTCRAGCATSAECAGCAGGMTCCFIGTCIMPPFGFCPDFGGGDGGTDTGVRDVGTDTGTDSGSADVTIDAPVSTDVPVVDVTPASDAPTKSDTGSKPSDSGSVTIDSGPDGSD